MSFEYVLLGSTPSTFSILLKLVPLVLKIGSLSLTFSPVRGSQLPTTSLSVGYTLSTLSMPPMYISRMVLSSSNRLAYIFFYSPALYIPGPPSSLLF
jgi:hypothetical protein